MLAFFRFVDKMTPIDTTYLHTQWFILEKHFFEMGRPYKMYFNWKLDIEIFVQTQYFLIASGSQVK